MLETQFYEYWKDLPTGKENAVTYGYLCDKWHMSERRVRVVLHDLQTYDSGDDLILIRSARGKGFYKTSDADEIKAYKKECLNKGKSIFAPIKKINKVLNEINAQQLSLTNNMKLFRNGAGYTQAEVADMVAVHDAGFDKVTLCKIENSNVYPTPYQLFLLSRIYACEPSELISYETMLDVI